MTSNDCILASCALAVQESRRARLAKRRFVYFAGLAFPARVAYKYLLNYSVTAIFKSPRRLPCLAPSHASSANGGQVVKMLV